MDLDQIFAAISLIAVLILVLPAFFRTNLKLKQFFTNLSIWTIIVFGCYVTFISNQLK
jgi:hypothetical protein